MALITCPECTKQISEYAHACPNCGCPMTVIKELINKIEQEQLEARKREEERIRKEKLQKEIQEKRERQLAEQKLEEEKIRRQNELKLEEKRQALKRQKEAEEYKKYLQTLEVSYFDLISLICLDGDKEELSFRVDINCRPGDKKFIGLKYGEIWIDDRGYRWRITDIKKNNPYEGLEDILPGRYMPNSSPIKGSVINRQKPYYDIRS